MTPGKLSSYTDLELALMILLGCYGNGDARRRALGSRYSAAQGLVEKMLASNKVPNGAGTDPAALNTALSAVFDDCIREVTEEVIERMR